jgi:uncharacterized protein
VPYGEEITVKKLRQIEDAEALVKDAGFPINRVRHYGDTARVEVAEDLQTKLAERREAIAEGIRRLGFAQVDFDREGFVSGKLNRVINNINVGK